MVVLFDVTSEQSFLNVRNWVESVRAGVDEGCLMLLVANKLDLCAAEQARAVSQREGQQLAADFDLLYFETSAFTGEGIPECMRALAL